MTHDYTYLSQLTVADLLDRARAHGDDGLIRALADRLEEHIDALADYDALNAELMDAALLRFINAVETLLNHTRDYYGAALAAATAEARRRNLVPQEKGPAMTPGRVTGRKT
jgi:hypothetical protein